MENILVRDERCKIQPAPAVQTHTAEQAHQGVGFVFSVRPQLCDTNRKVGIGSLILQIFHEVNLLGSQGEREATGFTPLTPDSRLLTPDS